MPQLVLGAVVVDGEAYVVLLHKLLDTGKSIWSGVPSDDHLDTRSLAILELAADVVVLVLGEIDRSGSVELNAGRMIVVERFRLRGRIHGEMIFDILGIQCEHVELLHVANQLRAIKIAEGIAAQAQTNRRGCAMGLCYYR